MISDYALAAWAVWLGVRLLRGVPPDAPWPRRLWATAYLAGALAAAVGGTLHGMPGRFSAPAWSAAWGVVHGSIDVSGLAALLAMGLAILPLAARPLLAGAVGLRVVGNAATVASGDMSFRFSFYDGTVALLGLLGFALSEAFLRRAPGSVDALVGVLIALAGVFVQGARLSPHPFFNHNDVFHVALMATLGLLFRAARRAGAVGSGAGRGPLVPRYPTGV
jgi:hypothetical protein